MTVDSKDSIEIFHMEGRRSFRVIWLCEEMRLPYRLAFQAGDLMGSFMQLRQAHPQMPMAPTVRIDGEFVVESGAILDILEARHGNGQFAPPVSSRDYLYHQQWMHFAEATAMCRMATNRFIAGALGVDVDQVVGGYRSGRDTAEFAMVGPLGIFDFVEDYLAKHPYFGGASFSTADIMMHYAVRGAPLLAWVPIEDYPLTVAWREKVEARPAFDRATRASVPGGANEYGLPLGDPLPFPDRPKYRA